MDTKIPNPEVVDPEASPKVVSIARHADFKPAGTPTEGPPVQRGYFGDHRCLHQQFEVDSVARLVRCAGCHVELDPIDALNQLATYDWRWVFAESERFREEREALKQEVAKLRAARNALRRKGPPA